MAMKYKQDYNRGYGFRSGLGDVPPKSLQKAVNKRIKIKIKPLKVRKIVCVMCGELLVKIFPWCALKIAPGRFLCTKCEAKLN